VVADASLLPRGGTASVRLSLAWSSQRLLLCNAEARWPRQHAAQSRGRDEERPEHGPGASNTEPTCGSRRIDAACLDRRLTRTPEPPVGGLVTTARESRRSDDRLGSWVPLILTHARAHNSRPHCV
jgi:hypothetical protein